MTRVVALDLMDTMLADPFREALHAALGPDWLDIIKDRPRDVWPRFERGEISEDEFWSLTADSHAADRDAFDRVRREGMDWLGGMRDLVDDLRGAGTPVVVGTNYPVWIDEVERRFLAGCVDAVVASCRIGARKPEPAFYDAIVAASGQVTGRDVAPGQVVFVDDRQPNVDGALEAGMHGVHFRDASSLRAALGDLGVPITA